MDSSTPFSSDLVIPPGIGTCRPPTVSIPGGMTKSEEKGVELSIPGFGSAQASYRGKLEPNQVVDFYKKEMPARGWKPSIGVLSQGGMLTYAKEDKSLIVMVGKSNGDT